MTEAPYAAGAVDPLERRTDPPTGDSVPGDRPDLLGLVDRIDDRIDSWWERLRGTPTIDRIFYTASEAADFSILWHTLGVAQALIRDDPRIAIELSAALGIESALVNGPIKSLFRRSRPVEQRPRPHSLRQPRTSSFPSGHASAAMVAAALLSRRSRFGLLWYGLAVIVALSRTHVRIHHASDVVGGATVGIALGGHRPPGPPPLTGTEGRAPTIAPSGAPTVPVPPRGSVGGGLVGHQREQHADIEEEVGDPRHSTPAPGSATRPSRDRSAPPPRRPGQPRSSRSFVPPLTQTCSLNANHSRPESNYVIRQPGHNIAGMDLEGTIAVVTGGASGIGRALARRFADEKAACVVVVDLDGEGATSVADEIGGRPVELDTSGRGGRRRLDRHRGERGGADRAVVRQRRHRWARRGRGPERGMEPHVGREPHGPTSSRPAT